jgi:hypothetical protein
MSCRCSTPDSYTGAAAGSVDTGFDAGAIEAGTSKFCFSCTTFWVIIALVFLALMAGSRR